MSGGIYVLCPHCDHITNGRQDHDGRVYPEAHQCAGDER